jgi:TonB-dependent SusC/RagA subfamily outer membrane receptor
VTLRGESILDFNSPGALIVVDGEPINTSFQGVGHGAYLGGDSPIDFGSALTDIDPNNIESINVLKGPAASALYGSRAGNGAIIITTKSASKDKKGLGVSFNSYVSVDQVNRWPDYQYQYGQGTAGQNYYSYGTTADGAGTQSTSSAWDLNLMVNHFINMTRLVMPMVLLLKELLGNLTLTIAKTFLSKE